MKPNRARIALVVVAVVAVSAVAAAAVAVTVVIAAAAAVAVATAAIASLGGKPSSAQGRWRVSARRNLPGQARSTKSKPSCMGLRRKVIANAPLGVMFS